AKICVVDDVWATIGSDNFNRRSWTHDSELSAAIVDTTRDPRLPTDPGGLGDGARTYARDLRLLLAREHLDAADNTGLLDPDEAFDRFASSAAALQAWCGGGRTGPRPPGRLRPLAPAPIGPVQRLWATRVYRRAYDPDGRPRHLRAGAF
ncbi:MAG: phospholipase, partial [Pseudorhodobacter sp.]|nr:phospholipase [Frankiaceae bacterium]